MHDHEPIFNVPRSVQAVLAALVGVHLLRQFLSPDDDLWLVLLLAFIPARYAGFAEQLPGGDVSAATSFLTHMLVHGDWMHLAFNSAWLLAFGGAVALRVGSVRFLLFSALCGIAGALTFLAFNPGLMQPVVGASGAISGLMGGTMRYLFPAMDRGGFHLLRDRPRDIPMMSLAEALADRRVQLTTAVWLLMNGLAILGLGTGEASGGIAWEAHVGGYLAGLLAFGWFDFANAKVATGAPPTH